MLIIRAAMRGKKLSPLLAALLFTLSLAGCGDRHSTPPVSPAGTVTVVDMAGRTVEIPENVNSVATLYGIATSYIVALGKADKLVAAPFTSDFFKMLHPVFENLGSVGRGRLDIEALARFKPDLFIGRADDVDTLNSAQELGIPAIGVAAETRDDITALLSLFGKVFGAGDRADELITYYGRLLDKAKDISGDIPADKKKSAIVMSARIGSVANGTMLQSLMIETAGGINCAKDVPSAEIWPVVGTETIFEWNPDFIFNTNSGPSSGASRKNVETLTTDPAWANLTAVKEKHVYIVPADKDTWEFPGVSSALGSLWMLSTMYPDRLGREQFDAVVREFYEKVYNLDVTSELMGY